MGGVFQLFQEGTGISRNWATTHFLILMVGLGTVMVPVDVSLSLLCYSEHILKLKVWWKSTCPPSWTHLVLISLCHVLGLCHSFKGCALPPSLLFHYYHITQLSQKSGICANLTQAVLLLHMALTEATPWYLSGDWAGQEG